MDDQVPAIDINLDPDMITPFGQTPTAVQHASPVIDITPGNSSEQMHDARVNHIDMATTPNPGVIDITPDGKLDDSFNEQPSEPTTPDVSTSVPTPALTTTETSSLEDLTPSVPTPALTTTETPAPSTPEAPAPTLPAIENPTPTLSATTEIPTQNQNPAPAPVTPIAETPTPQPTTEVAASAESDTLKIDTTSPLYEDPDKVTLVK